MNPFVEHYLQNGCGRCKNRGTPNCKVRLWQEELALLRKYVLECGLSEEFRMGLPAYFYHGTHILTISSSRDSCFINFIKGNVLSDTLGLLTKPMHTSVSSRLLQLSSLRRIVELEGVIKTYIFEVIEHETSPTRIKFEKGAPLTIPQEFLHEIEADPALKEAFFALTPTRQRAYLLYFMTPMKAVTRANRVQNNLQRIKDGLPLKG